MATNQSEYVHELEVQWREAAARLGVMEKIAPGTAALGGVIVYLKADSVWLGLGVFVAFWILLERPFMVAYERAYDAWCKETGTGKYLDWDQYGRADQ